MATWKDITGLGQLSQKSFVYEQLVTDMPLAIIPIGRALKTE